MTPFEHAPWRVQRLGDVCAGRELVDPTREPDRLFRYVDIASVSNRRFVVVEPKEVLGRDAPSRARKRIRAGDVIVATTRPYLRSIARVTPDLDGAVCSTGFCVLRPTSRVLSDWLFYASLTETVVAQLTERMRGASYPAVTDGDVLDAMIPVAPIEEQRRIVALIGECMERIDEIELLREKMRREAESLTPSSLASVFEDIGAAHTEVPIADVIVESRYGTSQKCNAPSSATPVLRIPNVAKGEVNFDNLKYCDLDNTESARLRLSPGDLLIVRTNGSPDLVGRCAVFDHAEGDYAYASYLIRLRPNCEKIDPYFLSFFLASTLGRDAIARIRRTSAGQYNVNSENLRAIKVPLPPLLEQTRIAERLREQQAIALAIARDQSSRVDEAGNLRGAVLRKAFAGEF